MTIMFREDSRIKVTMADLTADVSIDCTHELIPFLSRQTEANPKLRLALKGAGRQFDKSLGVLCLY